MSTTAKPMIASALDFAARSDTGRARENNEDSFRIAAELGLFILSDGMGGLDAGEVASKLAVETIYAQCRDAESNPELPYEGERVDGASETSNRLASAIQMANRLVRAAAADEGEIEHSDDGSDGASRPQKGMGATVVALQFFADRVSVAHVGDSRAYRLRSGEFLQLTDDHSLVAQQVREGRMTEAEAEASPLKNVLMRALGVDETVEVEVDEEIAIEGDTYLLCSDGLTRELTDGQIAAILTEMTDAQSAADQLIDLANLAGGGDNITAIVVRVGAKSGGTLGKIGRWITRSGN
ncbi:MAG TPA: protein phosphatase 2C domain-containing protein [Candidatus Acidoferrales bacterium]|nr:protein phosphatase 2C domain-containing protein [Candidatus Acidoferrales bacterium]